MLAYSFPGTLSRKLFLDSRNTFVEPILFQPCFQVAGPRAVIPWGASELFVCFLCLLVYLFEYCYCLLLLFYCFFYLSIIYYFIVFFVVFFVFFVLFCFIVTFTFQLICLFSLFSFMDLRLFSLFYFTFQLICLLLSSFCLHFVLLLQPCFHVAGKASKGSLELGASGHAV